VSIDELERGLSVGRTGPGFDRTPPQDIVAEQSVLGGMLLSKDAIADVVEHLKGVDFYRPAHELIYEAVLDLYGRGEPADAVTVSAELTKRGEIGRIGGAPYLHTLISMVPTAANAGYYARIVRERAVLRRLVEAGTRIVQLGYAADGGDVDELVNTAQAEVYAVTEQRTSEDYLPLAEILGGTMEEIESAGHRGEGMVGVPTGFIELDRLTNGLHPGQMIVLAARPALGKALALDTPLPTPTGWTTMAEVRVGDQLLAIDGTPTTVVAATEVMTGRPCYEVTFDDGSVLLADGQHQWLTETRASRKSRQAAAVGYNRYRNQRTFAAVRTTEEIAATLRCETADRRLNHSVPTARALALPNAELPVPPYALGVWLGDGHSASARFTSDDPEISMRIESVGLRSERLAGGGGRLYSIRMPQEPPVAARSCVVCGKSFIPALSQVRTCGRSCGGRAKGIEVPVAGPTCVDCGRPTGGNRRCRTCHRTGATVAGRLRGLGVLGDKHIPASYLRASEPQRRELLAGLLDTDGTVAPSGSVQFTVTNERLALGVRELLHSLGYRTGWSTRAVHGRGAATSTAYVITFTTDDEVFALERKKLAHKERRRRSTPRLTSRFVTSVRRVESVPVRCVEIDHPDHLYLAGPSMIPTHNSTLATDILRSAAVKHGLTSVIFSLEMSRTEITMRMLAAESQVLLQSMRNGRMRDEDWQKLAASMGRLSQAPLFIDDSPNMSLMEIRAKCRRLKQRHDLKLVVIDYLQLMSSGKRVESRQQEVSEFSRALKLLAKELGVPVIAISQLNRGAEQRTDKRPQLSDLRESGAIEQDADVVILLHREDFYEKESPRPAEADLIVAKHRNGPTDTIVVTSQLHYARFVNMPQGM
jgi:replicative DNA helicase